MAKKERVPYDPTDEERREAPPRVLYERNMFFASLNACFKLSQMCHKALHEELPWTQEDDDLRKITLEATLFHARNLLDFFTGDPTFKDDIQAAHFLSDRKGWKSDKLKLLRARRDDLNFSISHLTYRRVTQDRPQWNALPHMADEICAAFDEFIRLLPDHERSQWQW